LAIKMRLFIFLRLLLVLMLIELTATPAVAWWSDEHRTIALIAEAHLTDQSRQQIKKMAGDKSLATLSLWADQIKSQQPWAHTRSWHYVNIDRSQSVFSFQPKIEGDILWALRHFYQALGDDQLPQESRRQALLFFIHFAGDIHQPLHVGERHDRGGNRIAVKWLGRSRTYNLHQIWDGLLTKNNLSNQANARRLLQTVSDSQIKQWQDSSFIDWAEESQTLLESVYSFGASANADKGTKPLVLGDRYLETNRTLAEKRLLQAGIRIAHYLNSALAD
jgi:hypothetical protein